MGVCLCACVPKSYDDPLGKMLDRSEDPARRMVAAQQAKSELGNDPKRVKALEELAWTIRHPAALRIFAIDELIALDETKFRKDLETRIVLAGDWSVVEHIFDVAYERHWPDMTPIVVRHYALKAHGIPDEDRMERNFITRLNPDRSVEQVIFDVFANFDADTPSQIQVAAWNLLYRLNGRESMLGLLADAPDNTALVIDLKAAARDLKVLPVNKEGVLWLMELRDARNRAYWDAARDLVARLSGEQLEGLALRHIAVLIRVGDSALSKTRGQLISTITSRMQGDDHYVHGPTFDGPMADYPRHFYVASEKLCWGDLVAAELFQSVVREPNVARALFAQTDADRADRSTEYGGAMVYEDGQYLVKLFKPMMRVHDLKFFPSDEMVQRLYTGLAHYHYHAQEKKNSHYAGPGVGDLKMAAELNFHFLVFTSIDEDTLNVDYYQPDGVVVDLGTVKR